MAEKHFWDNGDKIYLLLRETGSPEKTVMLDVVYRMDAKDLKQFWLAKLYRQEIASFPKTLKSNEAVKRFVAQAPNAIGFIDGRYVDSTVKTLTIDGKSMRAPGYPLTDQTP
jgi:ABC-type phosphate transport system substrate-binding protein